MPNYTGKDPVMNVAQSERLAVRYHPCPQCGQPSQRRCKETVKGQPGRWRYLPRPHQARVELVADGETWQPGDNPYCPACGGDGWLPSEPEGRSECHYCHGTGRDS